MTTNRLIYFIAAAFVTGNLILIYIKYTSDNGIENLIADNEKLVNELKINNQFEDVQNDVVLVQNKIRDMVAFNDSSYGEGVDTLMANVRYNLNQLQKITNNDSSEAYVDQLDSLVTENFSINKNIFDNYKKTRFPVTEALLDIQKTQKLTYSILSLTEKIGNERESTLSQLNSDIDQKVKRMQRQDSLVIIIVLVSAAGIFWYIVNALRTQNRLVQQVRNSEKKAKEAVQVKENFLANMSHEIRTPLNAILGFTNLLRRKKLDEESNQYVQTIQRSGESLLSIINEILDLSKIEAGMMRIEAAPFSIRGLIHSVETLFQTKKAEKKILLSTRVDDSLPDVLVGDAVRLTQVLVNLIDNAIKFTDIGEVLIDMRNEGIDGKTVKVGFDVKDTGIGIPKEKLDRIFDRFQQADDSVTREYGGSGLGLSIVKELVELQKGQITATSEPNKGTTFHLSIPYDISKDQFQIEKEIIQPREQGPRIQDSKILIVEDNKVNLMLIEHLFRIWNIDFDIANNGFEAIEKLKRDEFDLILMDIQMPQLDGYAAAQRIRNDLKLNTPIIAMTAHAMSGERERCLSYGMNEYISKPIREEQLKKLIAQFLPLKISPAEIVEQPKWNRQHYKFINLDYMLEVSAGNKEYEKDVTKQFIEAVPRELRAMENAALHHDKDSLRRIAHNLRTTISVMGLNEKLEPFLDAIEFREGENNLKENVESINRICENALGEAKDFLTSLEALPL